MPPRTAHFAFRKGSPWIKILNQEILKHYDFFDQVHRRYFEVGLLKKILTFS